MKIKLKEKTFNEVKNIAKPKHHKPMTPIFIFRWLVRVLSVFELISCKFKYNKTGMDKLGKQPALILMNHSCFLDLKIASHIFRDRPFNIVCTSDGFIGKPLLMRLIGCIPTLKFVPETQTVKDIKYAIERNKCSVLMYPEASYSFDGTATPLPESLGKLIKLLGAPIVTVITHGAFAHNPLYNELKLRKVKVSADVTYLLTPEEIKSMSPDEINLKLKQVFSFDNFRWQQENKVKVQENFRAEGLNRVLYKCPHCNTEGDMESSGTTVSCKKCGVKYTLDEFGFLNSKSPIFTHIPDWYNWERECVLKEIKNGSYKMSADVDICVMADYKAIYKVGSGSLTHTNEGFHLVGLNGELDYKQSPLNSYGLYADYYWYELGDIICIGDKNRLYYCFPKGEMDIVAKTRLAAEELYKYKKAQIKKEDLKQ